MAHDLAALHGLTLSLWAPPGRLPRGVDSAATESEASWLAGMASRGGIAQILKRGPLRGLITAGSLVLHEWRAYRRVCPDLIHVNWLQNALALGRTSTPALITVLGSDMRLRLLPGMRGALRAVLASRNAALVPNAEWMVEPLRRDFGDQVRIQAVPFGVAPEWFEVRRDSAAAVSGDWLVVSRITRAKIGDLLDWGAGLFGVGRRLHLFGPMQEPLPLPEWVVYHGPTYPQQLRSEWFPRAAGLITLSRHDEGRPQVMVEAMAAGLPVVASDQAAHRDFVRNGDNGYLVRSAEEFATALQRLEDEAENRRIGASAGAWIRRSVGSWADCARRYAAIYRALVES
jgi:glycosyltransferase involved in cell wall biosynthesis